MPHQQFLFISYAREDGAFALRLAHSLREAGIAIWLDKLDIPSGARWDTAIQQALNDCASLLVVLSPASVASENVLDEIGFALHKKKHIVPVLFRPCDMPFRLHRFQYVDFTENYEHGLRELLEDLLKVGLFAPRVTPAVKPPTPPQPKPKPEIVPPPEKKTEPRPAPRPSPPSPQTVQPAFAWRRYAIPFALVAALALILWKGVDWSGSSKQEPQVTKKLDDISTETKRENKTEQPTTTPGQREQPRLRPKPEGMVFIKGGTFLMGSEESDDEKPVHTVIVNDFYLDEHEVTVAAYQSFISATRHAPPPQWAEQLRNREHPVVYVSWNDAKAYAKWAGKRLPYEAEWEYAARGGNTGLNGTPHYKYPWGDELSHERANYDGTEGRDRWERTSPVKSFPATGFGLYDMAGNVWEWCEDWYDANYYTGRPSPDRNPKGPSTGQYRVLRGGSWLNSPRSLRCAFATGSLPRIGSAMSVFVARRTLFFKLLLFYAFTLLRFGF